MSKYLKKLLLIVSSAFFLNNLNSQNLVKNPSFEEYSNCPDASGQLEYSNDWFNPNSSGSPDYYNACSDLRGVPSCCGSHFQYAKTGVAYAGLFTYNYNFPNIREYVQNKLIDSLTIDKCYFFSMYVNSFNLYSFGTNGLGVYFSDNQITGVSGELILNYNPQIYTETVIYDTLNWVQIWGFYKPNSNDKYITIGNFFDDNSTDTIRFFEDIQRSAVYLIDDVSLYQLGNGYAGKDSTILLGTSIFIGQDVENLPIKWSVLGGAEIANNVSGVLVSPTVTTTYVCEQNFCGEVMYDTITVAVVDDVGLENLKENESEIRVYPNPSNGEFYISISESSSKNQLLEILDMSGKLVYSDSIQFENGSLKLIRNLESGIYVFKLTDEQTKGQVLKKVTISNFK